MEYRFENHYTRTPELLKELYAHLYFLRPVSIVVYCILTVLAVVNLIFNPANIFMNLVYFALILLMEFFLFRKAVKLAVERDASRFGENQLQVQTRVTEDEFHCQYGESTTRTVALDDIKGIWQTKNLIVVRTKIKLVILVHKENFTVGDPEAFLAFLRSKGIKA